MAETLLVALPYVTAAVGVGGTIMSAVSSAQAGRQQAAAYAQQAEAEQRNAEQSRATAGQALAISEAEVQRSEQEARRRAGTATARGAASGVDPGFGSPLDVMADIAAEDALDTQIARWKGRNQANAYLTQAANQQTQAGYTAQRAGEAASAGTMRAATTLLGGAAQWGAMLAPRMGTAGSAARGVIE